VFGTFLFIFSSTSTSPFAFRMLVVMLIAFRTCRALIMAQTTLNIFASDQIFNFVMRVGGTFVGLLIGLVAWYIGTPNSLLSNALSILLSPSISALL
jgi:hypothetical protein